LKRRITKRARRNKRGTSFQRKCVLYTCWLRRSFFPVLVFWGFCLVFVCKFFHLITVYHFVAALSQVFSSLVGRESLSLGSLLSSAFGLWFRLRAELLYLMLFSLYWLSNCTPLGIVSLWRRRWHCLLKKKQKQKRGTSFVRRVAVLNVRRGSSFMYRCACVVMVGMLRKWPVLISRPSHF